MEAKVYGYEPDYAVSPGEILEERLAVKGMKKTDFAKRCALPPKMISQIISGEYRITPETAIKFERILGVSSSVWNNLEASYRLHIAQTSARKQLSRSGELINKFPMKELLERGFIKPYEHFTDKIEQLLNFFSAGSLDVLKKQYMGVKFRHSESYRSAPEALATWLRIGELYAEKIHTEPFDERKFKSALREIRQLTALSPKEFESKMKELCRKSGVALVFVSEMKGTHLSGATRWLNKDKALIMLSLRHKTDDHFWFSFYHEAGHILLHGKRESFIDEQTRVDNDEEREANEFASEILIPKAKYNAFLAAGRLSRERVMSFAHSQGISAGIVVGRLQHDEKIPHKDLNALKKRFELIENHVGA